MNGILTSWPRDQVYSVAKSFRFFPERGRVGWGWGGSPCTRYLPILREALPTNIEYLSPHPPHLDLLMGRKRVKNKVFLLQGEGEGEGSKAANDPRSLMTISSTGGRSPSPRQIDKSRKWLKFTFQMAAWWLRRGRHNLRWFDDSICSCLLRRNQKGRGRVWRWKWDR